MPPRKKNGQFAKGVSGNPKGRPKRAAPGEAENRLSGLFVDTVENGDIRDYCQHIGLELTRENLASGEMLWSAFKALYTENSKIDEDKAFMDLATYPPVAQAIVRNLAEQKQGELCN
jgi:hypothetical protein